MKLLILISLLPSIHISSYGQQPFLLSLEQPEIDCINDVTQIGDKFYFLQNRAFNYIPPYDFDNYCDLIITDNNGSIIEIDNLQEDRTYQRILKVIDDDIYLVGFIKSDSCKSRLIFSKFNILTHLLVDLSSYDFCNYSMLKIKIIEGISGQIFIEEYHGNELGIRKMIFKLDSNYTIIPVNVDISFALTLSIDFSRNGYILADSRLYNFYDTDFNYRKQIFKNYNISYSNETHLPFRQNLILVATTQTNSGFPDLGIQIRLMDSLLNLKKKVVIFPIHYFVGNIYLPFYGGVDIKNKNEIWTAGHYEQIMPLDSGFYYIAKLDSNLNIICEHFLGYDTWYRTYGIRSLENGGAIVFGSRLREGHELNEGEDIFAIRVGENCELPVTVSTSGPREPLLSISAYPNPGINDLTFSVNGFDPATLRMELINEAGQKLFTAEDLTNSIQVPELPAGQYFYRILQKERLLGIGSWVKQ